MIVHSNEESPVHGEVFTDLREAMERIKSRASSEGKTVRDYSIIPITEQEI